MDSYAMLCEDWGSAYRISRDPGAPRELIRADYLAHPVPREATP
jgi:hypothetical protein